MAEFAVREALATVEKVIIELYKIFERPTILHDDVERAQKFLEVIHACLIDSEDFIDEGSELNRKCVDLAYGIENALDEFMLQLISDDFQTNKTFHKTDDEVPDDAQTDENSHNSDGEVSDDVQTSVRSHNSDDEVPDDVQTDESSHTSDDELAQLIGPWEAGRKLSAYIKDIIENNIGFVKELDSLQKDIPEGSSRSRLGDSLSYADLAEGDEVVGFEEHIEKLCKQLKEEDSKLLTVLIVGPGGSGKSTLVKNVLESEQVQGFFDFKAWVAVPRRLFQLNELLLNMLANFEKTPASEEKIDPRAKLRLLLQEKRYVIVLDDVWRKEDLQCIVKALPNGLCGSRIIITTRNSDVSSFLSPKYSHDLCSGLSWEKAKHLFFKRAFHKSEGNCPPELERSQCFDNILRWCGGLPFAISKIGSLLAMKPQTAEGWMEFHETLGSGSCLLIISSILQPSYIDLPNHLKTCFLYLSVFPVDYCIEPQRLIHLWVAEGFVKAKRGITEEQVAERYLNELIARSLVLATEREIHGQVRSCRVVTHVRDFLLSKADNFITVFEPDCSTKGTSGEQIRRLSIHQAGQSDCVYLESLIARMDLKHIRTLLVFTKCLNGLDKLLKANKYLRVLDLSEVIHDFKCVHLKYSMEFLDDFILLKYLSLQGFKIENVRKSIKKLQFLETLNIQATEVTKLPKEICQLYNLRHLLVSSNSLFSTIHCGVKFSAANIGVLSSIQSLSLINVEKDTIIIKGLGELKDLKKLGLVNLEEKDGKELCIALEKTKHLSTLDLRAKVLHMLDLDHISTPPLYLQNLYLSGRLQGLPKWIPKLTSLQKIDLHKSDLMVKPTELLQDLPNLIELHLERYYRGEELVFRAHTFKKLMKLSIENFDALNSMEVEDGALPMLRELNMRKCSNLKSFPNGISGLKSLYKLVLDDMPDEFVAMLQKDSPISHEMVRHIPVVLFNDMLLQDFENVSSTPKTQASSEGRGGLAQDNDEILSSSDDISKMSQDHDEIGNSAKEGHYGKIPWYSKILRSKLKKDKEKEGHYGKIPWYSKILRSKLKKDKEKGHYGKIPWYSKILQRKLKKDNEKLLWYSRRRQVPWAPAPTSTVPSTLGSRPSLHSVFHPRPPHHFHPF